MTWSSDRKPLIALGLATLAAVADLVAVKTGHYQFGSAGVLALACAVLAPVAAAALLQRHARQTILWSLGIIVTATAALSVAYLRRLCYNGGHIDLEPGVALALGLLIAMATPLVVPVLAWTALALAYLIERNEDARWVVPLVFIGCFAVCIIVFPPLRVCSH